LTHSHDGDGPFKPDTSAEHTASPGTHKPVDGATVRTDLKDGQVVALESFRPVPGAGGSTKDELVAYALRELEPFLELAREGKIRAVVVAAELVDDRASITYPVGQWEPGLIAATELLKTRLIQQG
jgi:hypothetical protein